MIVAGCDVGSLTSKALILNNKNVLGYCVIRSKTRPEESAREVFELALKKAAVHEEQVMCCVGTGYGRNKIPFIQEAVSEITCHGKGALWVMPRVRTVIDIGGQDCKAIRIDKEGTIQKFTTNDKCAAGTGRFLEVMAKLLGVAIDELGGLKGGQNQEPLTLSSACTVWAQAEVIHHLNIGKSKGDIAEAINRAMAGRVAILVGNVGLEKDVCMTGGVAKNTGVVRHLEKMLGVKIKRLKFDPQIMGALGAAIIAKQMYTGENP
ncbi:MAG: 2-hydroxyglutaryl-CoA dehydratase [Deltaproteobacteria bacterium]|nr:2-hydroxyglutaryl-CoA dehydratase [Deltaproteobacteria bacterium]